MFFASAPLRHELRKGRILRARVMTSPLFVSTRSSRTMKLSGMHMKGLRVGALGGAFYLALVTVCWATPFAYTVFDVGAVVGRALNDSAQLIGYGYSTPQSDGNAFLTGTNGKGFHVLGPFPLSGTEVTPSGINNAGQALGLSTAARTICCARS